MTQTTRKAFSAPGLHSSHLGPTLPVVFLPSVIFSLSASILNWFTCAFLFWDISFPYLTHPQTSSALPLQPPHLSGERKSTHCNSNSGNSISSRCDRKHMWQVFYLSELIHHSSIITTSCQDKAKFPFSLRFKWKSLSIFQLASIPVPEDKCYRIFSLLNS